MIVRGTNQGEHLYGAGAGVRIYGLGGDDILHPWDGPADLYGGAGIDSAVFILYEEGPVVIRLAEGRATGPGGTRFTLHSIETVTGGRFGDQIHLGGIETFSAGRGGHDALYGGPGNQSFLPGSGADRVFGGAGDHDTVSYLDDGWDRSWYGIGISAGAIVNLATGAATDGWGHADRLSGIEHVIGSQLHDRIAGDDAANQLRGGEGNDILSGVDGMDWLDGGTGDDRLDGGRDGDTLYGGEGRDTLQGGTGVDALYGGAADDFLYVGQQTALVDRTETRGGHLLDGGAGNDVLDAWSNDRGARDTLFGGGGADRFHVQNGDEIADMGRGDEAWVLNARPADWMVASRLGDDAVAVTFHNRQLGAVTDLRIEGAVAPAQFGVRYELGGSITVLQTGAAHAAARAQKMEFSRGIAQTIEALRTDVVPTGWEMTGTGVAEFLSDLMIDKTEGSLERLTNLFGAKAAQTMAQFAGGLAFTVGQHLNGQFDNLSDTAIAAKYLQSVSTTALSIGLGILFFGGTMPVWGSIGLATGLVAGEKVVEKVMATWFDAMEQELRAEADPANIAESIYFRPIDPPPAPLADHLLF